jgi:hypothetical protein
MEKAAAGTGSGRELSAWARCAGVAVWSCLAGAGWAQDAVPSASWADPLTVEVRSEQQQQAGMRVEVNASSLPRLDGQDGGFQAPRLDLTVLRADGAGLGLAMGMSNQALRGPNTATLGAAGNPTLRPVLDLGLTFRHALQNNGRIDITAWRRMNGDDDAYNMILEREPVYGARVEMKLNPAKRTSLKIDRGFFGMQMESGARISIKRRNGGPYIYYRNSF